MIKKYGLLFAWLIALISMLGSLFASEMLHMPVCVLCWYQRIALYPLVILLGMAAYREDKSMIIYALPFPVIGFFFSLYQYLEQMIPGFSPISFCTQAIPCDQIHFKIAGFITFPFLSMIACAMIFILLLFGKNDV